MRKLWVAFTAVVVLSFAVLGWTGFRIYQEAPPVPTRVVTTDGRQLIGPDDIYSGQNVWQSIGGMEVGSIWGHGSYVAKGQRLGVNVLFGALLLVVVGSMAGEWLSVKQMLGTGAA
jgi:nitric oxide reductase large subunit